MSSGIYIWQGFGRLLKIVLLSILVVMMLVNHAYPSLRPVAGKRPGCCRISEMISVCSPSGSHSTSSYLSRLVIRLAFNRRSGAKLQGI